MQLSLRIALIIITLIYLLFILRAIKRKKLQISLSIFWILTGVILMISIAIPNFINKISRWLGFELTTNMIFCVTIFIAFYLIFNLMILISDLKGKNVKLIQEISILKNRVNEIEKRQIKEDEGDY